MSIDQTETIDVATIDKASGDLWLKKVLGAEGRSVVLNLVRKFPLSRKADSFFREARAAIEGAGFRLQFSLMRPN